MYYSRKGNVVISRILTTLSGKKLVNMYVGYKHWWSTRISEYSESLQKEINKFWPKNKTIIFEKLNVV